MHIHYKTLSKILLICVCMVAFAACQRQQSYSVSPSESIPAHPVFKPLPPHASPQLKQLIEAAVAQAGVTKGYDPSYLKLKYPDGDVPLETGVCSDVVVRAFRKAGIDLQKEVHEDMLRAWSDYPKRWGAIRPDTNIDHRRVPNLMTYFTRHGTSLLPNNNPDDYLPGDVVAWDLGGGIDHIGIITNFTSESAKRCLIVHNIGSGVRVEDVLFAWTIKGHYRYFR